jgi:hypothetical protein
VAPRLSTRVGPQPLRLRPRLRHAHRRGRSLDPQIPQRPLRRHLASRRRPPRRGRQRHGVDHGGGRAADSRGRRSWSGRRRARPASSSAAALQAPKLRWPWRTACRRPDAPG